MSGVTDFTFLLIAVHVWPYMQGCRKGGERLSAVKVDIFKSRYF